MSRRGKYFANLTKQYYTPCTILYIANCKIVFRLCLSFSGITRRQISLPVFLCWCNVMSTVFNSLPYNVLPFGVRFQRIFKIRLCWDSTFNLRIIHHMAILWILLWVLLQAHLYHIYSRSRNPYYCNYNDGKIQSAGKQYKFQ